jgi:hypothetical protein
MVSPNGTDSSFAQHTVVWDGAPDGGLGFAAWDASGDYIYLVEDFNGPSIDQWLLVLDVRTAAGSGDPQANEVARYKLTGLIGATGYEAASQVQTVSASYQVGGSNGSYSFKPGTVVARSDTSLCLMISFADWSLRRNNRFPVIFDLPAMFDPMSGLSCSVATQLDLPITNFEGSDFTTLDGEIIGRDMSKNRATGVWIFNMDTGTRKEIIGDGGFPDWSN